MKGRVVLKNVSALIIDDDEIQGNYLKHSLEAIGAAAVLVFDPDEFLSVLKEDDFDIVFIDYMMPKANGLSIFHSVLSEFGGSFNTPTLLMDNDFTESFGKEIFRTGYTNYLEKPVSKDSLSAALYLYLPKEKFVLQRERQHLHERGASEVKVPVVPESPVYEDEGVPAFLYEVEGMDVKEGLKNCGSAESFVSAVKLFHGSIKKKADEIEGFFNNQDINNYTIWVHALKSSARIIGIAELSEKARLMEEAGNKGDLSAINEATPGLLSDYRSYLDILSRISEDKDEDKDNKLPEIPPDVLDDAYESLRSFSDEMDIDLCEMVLKSIKEYTLPKEDEERMKKLYEMLLELDWDGMKKILPRE